MNFKLKKFTIREFNNDVNLSGNLDDKFLKWSAYRENIRCFINKAFTYKPDMKSIIVFGAGECNDIDLHYLTRKFKKVTLTDVDEKSMSDGIIRQALNENEINKIEIIQIDYTGLENENFFITFSELADNIALEGKITLFVEDAIKGINTTDIMYDYKNSFDMVLSCPVYTQLIYTQAEVLLKILKEFRLYSNSDLKKIIKSVNKSMSHISSKYNDLLLSVTAPGGLITVLTDIIELPVNDSLLPEIKDCLSSIPINTKALEIFVEKKKD